MLLGAGIALLTSLAWAISSIILKSLTDRIDTVSINTIRMWVGSILLLTVVITSDRHTAIFDMPMESLVYVVISGILAMAIGDTIYIKGLALLDASIAFPISQCAFVVIASLAAILLLDEPYTWITGIGAFLVMTGIYLIASGENGKAKTEGLKSISKKGVFIALLAAVIWTASTVTLKIGAEGMDVFLVAAIRISVSAVVLTFIAIPRRKQGVLQLKQYDPKTLGLIATAGLLTYGVAAVGYVSAIQIIGAGKTVLLTASAPLFALPISVVFLNERPTRSTIAGIIISVAGVCLVVL